ncbi:MAG TPA: hypothetical protein VH988_31965 [Thermoanaerobaculia bacterium]|jgi:hypothetical protein|nr:hypothetical protein [Thermoanaerobaculia bacterium]
MFLPKATLAALIALPLALLGEGRAAAVDGRIEQTIRSSRFIFTGTFETLGASNLSLLPASEQTALVRVREVIDQPPAFGPIRGALVTVQLASPAVAGGQAIFFTNGMLYGEHLAVSEVGRDPIQPGVAEAPAVGQLRKDVAVVRRREADEALATRLASAVAVVSGRIGSMRAARAAERGEEPGGEHSASWVYANLTVDATLKGKPAAGVYFAADADPFWALAPKLAPGQEGIFLLQRPVDGDVPAGAYVVVNPLDVLTKDQFARVRGLLK